MNTVTSSSAAAGISADHVTITPSILYFGTPVVLLSTQNEDGSFNLAPMSSAWALRFEPDKFAAAGLRPEPSELVQPPRVAECPLQLEARAARVQLDVSGGFLIVEAHVLKVHADPRMVVLRSQHIDPARWSRLIYNFRHYYGLGPELGHSFRSQTPRRSR
jgi:flavin reductase (DIM6/NTAB) family NADH-FMN oxidoreductase RutF